MRTKLTIGAIVLFAVITVVALIVAATIEYGMWQGPSIALAGTVIAIAFYRAVVRPWHSKWGATREEVERHMPGDDLLQGAPSTTRAISIAASPERIWPWLVQIGYGRAGWYSYDWIDNDGRPSADHIVSELQDLEVGDTIPFIPGLGPRVKEIMPPRWIVSAGEEDTWCLALYTVDDYHTRLVSRWRAAESRMEGHPSIVVLDPDLRPGRFRYGAKDAARHQETRRDGRHRIASRVTGRVGPVSPSEWCHLDLTASHRLPDAVLKTEGTQREGGRRWH